MVGSLYFGGKNPISQMGKMYLLGALCKVLKLEAHSGNMTRWRPVVLVAGLQGYGCKIAQDWCRIFGCVSCLSNVGFGLTLCILAGTLQFKVAR